MPSTPNHPSYSRCCREQKRNWRGEPKLRINPLSGGRPVLRPKRGDERAWPASIGSTLSNLREQGRASGTDGPQQRYHRDDRRARSNECGGGRSTNYQAVWAFAFQSSAGAGTAASIAVVATAGAASLPAPHASPPPALPAVSTPSSSSSESSSKFNSSPSGGFLSARKSGTS
jgi:hypothetical protein